MARKNLFDFDYNLGLPDNERFPLNESKEGRMVRQILLKDINNSTEYLIVTGFTSLANLIDIFGSNDFPNLNNLRIVIGYDPDERVGKRLPHYSLSTEIKNYWLRQNVSIRLCGPIINLIEKIRSNKYEFKVKDKLHAKIYVGNSALILGSSNFSKSGIVFQTEANIRVQTLNNDHEGNQYRDGKKVAEYYYSNAKDYNKELIDLLGKLLKDATWQEALARAISEIIESKWMKDYPALYQALVTHNLWTSQKIGIARAMKIIQDQGRVLIADPTGSGKTKFATALAYTLFHWLWENGLKDRSNALIICPKQVIDNWEKEQEHFKLYNKIESMGKLSLGNDRNQRSLQRQIESCDILVVDEAHNYLRPGSKRSRAISPKGSTHVILSTATPINKKADDLLRLIELLDIDNLSDDDLTTYLQLRRNRKKNIDDQHLEKLKSYVNNFIVRRTKKELNRMIEREPDQYRNQLGHVCKFPKQVSEIYSTGETENDKIIAEKIRELSSQLRGIHYLQNLKIPDYLIKEDDRIQFVKQRFDAATALSMYMIRALLRSSKCALIEYLHGTNEANRQFSINSTKNPSGEIIKKIKRYSLKVPKKQIEERWLDHTQRWLVDPKEYGEACQHEIELYNKISALTMQLSGMRESKKASMLIEKAELHQKILAFDSTIITLDYLQKLINEKQTRIKPIVATGQSTKNKNKVKEQFALTSTNDEFLIALCSDAMSEGINLQSAKAIVLLDMPSVLRIIEQRIGRLDRMDSEHSEVYIYWPNDSEAFALKGDKRVVEILLMTDNLIGNNVDIPQAIYEKYLKGGLTTQNLINAFQDYSDNNYEWEGVKDSTQYLYSLIEGDEALIDENLYQEFRDVDATVKTAVSFVESEKTWSFFAFRGNASRSPKWLFIDERNKAFTDFGEITTKLKGYLKKDTVIQRKWAEVDTQLEMKKLMSRLRKQEKNLLPWKKRRALEVGYSILNQFANKPRIKPVQKQKVQRLLELFNPETESEDYIDFDHFANLWLSILIPSLDVLKKTRIRKRKIFTLKDLKLANVKINDQRLNWLLTNCQYSNTLDEMISACIIGVRKI